MMRKTEKRLTRRSYCKPLVEQVVLRAEEAVLEGGCKFGYGAGHQGPRGNCRPDRHPECVLLGT
jgi:hypothetical protein